MQRMTSQRQLICNTFQRLGRPLTAQEVFDEAHQEQDSLGVATVYRAIKDLVKEDWLTPVELPNGPTRYEISGIAHHHHFHCRVCDRVFDIDGCPGDLSYMLPDGFTMESHEIIMFGTCNACQDVAGD